MTRFFQGIYPECERCDHCKSYVLRWVGHTKRVRYAFPDNQDVQQCLDCGRAWRYTKTGRHLTPGSYRVWRRDE